MDTWCRTAVQNGTITVLPHGAWRIRNLSEIDEALLTLKVQKGLPCTVDGKELTEIDTAGAMLLFRFLQQNAITPSSASLVNVTPAQESILKLVTQGIDQPKPLREKPKFGIVGRVGEAAIEGWGVTRSMLVFIGEVSHEVFRSVFRPSLIRKKELAIQLEQTGLNAVPIVCLVTFLIGIVIAYLTGVQIEKYGANIFIVDGVAIAMCRELSPILVAIIVAGRSGSAFTAQIGTMKLNEEIAAILTLGLSPTRVLVLPRLFALLLTLPLLVFAGDIAGILGGMFIADLRLGVTGATFIERLQNVLPLRHVFVGLAKAPAFAFFVAIIGCRMGFAVEDNARSVGINTTRTVVRSIVAVILLNAGFAVVLSELRI